MHGRTSVFVSIDDQTAGWAPAETAHKGPVWVRLEDALLPLLFGRSIFTMYTVLRPEKDPTHAKQAIGPRQWHRSWVRAACTHVHTFVEKLSSVRNTFTLYICSSSRLMAVWDEDALPRDEPKLPSP